MRRHFLFLIAVMLYLHGVSQQQPPRERVEAGFGKPKLFSTTSANLTLDKKGASLNVLPIFQRAFDHARNGDTLTLPYDAGSLRAVVMTKGSSGHLDVINLKVISHHNAIMRIERHASTRPVKYHAVVYHRDFSDALKLVPANGSASLSTLPLSSIINE